MPFPVDEKYILETEELLNFNFPTEYKEAMKKMNGGEINIMDDYFTIFPIFDKTDRKRISRTCNSVDKETTLAREFFISENAVAIAGDGGGNYLILFPNDPAVYFWHHENENPTKVAEKFSQLSQQF